MSMCNDVWEMVWEMGGRDADQGMVIAAETAEEIGIWQIPWRGPPPPSFWTVTVRGRNVLSDLHVSVNVTLK